ncbi:MAG: hypothetical protein ACM3ZT_11525 [Bacillota bacterium]
MLIEAYNEHLDCALDEALKGTFPASDPVSVSACRTLPAEPAGPAHPSPERPKEKRRAGEGK